MTDTYAQSCQGLETGLWETNFDAETGDPDVAGVKASRPKLRRRWDRGAEGAEVWGGV